MDIPVPRTKDYATLQREKFDDKFDWYLAFYVLYYSNDEIERAVFIEHMDMRRSTPQQSFPVGEHRQFIDSILDHTDSNMPVFLRAIEGLGVDSKEYRQRGQAFFLDLAIGLSRQIWHPFYKDKTEEDLKNDNLKPALAQTKQILKDRLPEGHWDAIIPDMEWDDLLECRSNWFDYKG